MMLSSGDWVAVSVGAVGTLKWGWDSVARYVRRNNAMTHDGEVKLLEIYSDLQVHKAEDRKEFGFIKDSLARIERRVENLQAQMGHVASGGNDHITHMKKD